MLKRILFLLLLNLQTLLALSRDKICSMELQMGKCRGHIIYRWYFNYEKRRCEKFIYSGCGGNANSFASKKECLGTCDNLCYQPISTGLGNATLHRFFYNQWSGSCEKFEYSGCGGNDNNFLTLKECRAVCQNECTLPRETGMCRAVMQRYFYNVTNGNCEMFIYGGCGGNANNFESRKDCKSRCNMNKPLDFGLLLLRG